MNIGDNYLSPRAKRPTGREANEVGGQGRTVGLVGVQNGCRVAIKIGGRSAEQILGVETKNSNNDGKIRGLRKATTWSNKAVKDMISEQISIANKALRARNLGRQTHLLFLQPV